MESLVIRVLQTGLFETLRNAMILGHSVTNELHLWAVRQGFEVRVLSTPESQQVLVLHQGQAETGLQEYS